MAVKIISFYFLFRYIEGRYVRVSDSDFLFTKYMFIKKVVMVIKVVASALEVVITVVPHKFSLMFVVQLEWGSILVVAAGLSYIISYSAAMIQYK